MTTASPCTTCDGCGRVANTERAEPWTAWERLPPGSDLAVRIGMVKPVTCPTCGGSGAMVQPAGAQLAPLHDDDLITLEHTLRDGVIGKLADWIQGARLLLSEPNPPVGLGPLTEQAEKFLHNLRDRSTP